MHKPLAVFAASAMTFAIASSVAAQSAGDPGSTQPSDSQPASGSGRGHRGGRNHHQDSTAPGAAPEHLKLIPDPVQRLDAGALMCDTEAKLQQHQAAIVARLSGKPADEPAGCHIVRAMTTVSVLTRHGPASTEVHIPGPPEQTGWTDSAVRDPDTSGP